MARTYIDKKTGKKLYPVCSWENNQHKLYNAHDRAMIRLYDGEDVYDELERIEKAMSAFDSCVIGGLVYAVWEDYCLIKSIIGGYDARH